MKTAKYFNSALVGTFHTFHFVRKNSGKAKIVTSWILLNMRGNTQWKTKKKSKPFLLFCAIIVLWLVEYHSWLLGGKLEP